MGQTTSTHTHTNFFFLKMYKKKKKKKKKKSELGACPIHPLSSFSQFFFNLARVNIINH